MSCDIDFENIENKESKMPWYVDWFCEWLCLVSCICGILTFCRFNPQIEPAFLEYYFKRQANPND
jgi:hypothetical protein